MQYSTGEAAEYASNFDMSDAEADSADQGASRNTSALLPFFDHQEAGVRMGE
jgi:hypothetical protein